MSIYFDNNSTTQLDERVLDVMLPFLRNAYGNPASSHRFGSAISKNVESARVQVAELIRSEPKEIVFTSGATEAINLALKGFTIPNINRGNHIVTVKTEHQAVLDCCAYLESIGFEVTYLDVNNEGLINLDELKDAIRQETILVSVMLVNNETGVQQPINDIAKIVREAKSTLFCDATQAVGKIPVHLDSLQTDMMAFSAHKFHGPKGAGVLHVRNSFNTNKILPLIHGGGHELGLRSGTLNVPAIIGLGAACEIASREMVTNKKSIEPLRDLLEDNLLTISGTFANGKSENRLYNVTNIFFPNIDAQAIIGQLGNISLSNGSACTSATLEPSHVLLAMGLNNNEASNSIRFSLSKFNAESEVRQVIELFSRMTR